ncbi:MAG: FAD-binding protein [Aeromicrobium sp.]|nr:MAG: FAD-binding protein [Aeromicrobium sp.]
MSSIVVVGAGFAGMSAAARLAKLGHDVAIYDAAPHTGGQMRGIEVDGTVWQPSSMAVTLPGVFRDLFRKSGRPMKAVIDLLPAPTRRHVFLTAFSRTELDMPFGTRSEQHDAIAATFGTDRWSEWVDSQVDTWDVVRRHVFDRVTTDSNIEDVLHHLNNKHTAFTAARRALKNKDLTAIATDRWRFIDESQKSLPALWNIWHYVERNFGLWRFDNDMAGLADALTTRLSERKVDMHLNTHVVGITMKFGRVVGIETANGPVEADIVVWASGHRLPGTPGPNFANPRTLTGIELDGQSLPSSLMVHGRACLKVWESGPNRWVVSSLHDADPIPTLKRLGITPEAIRTQVEFSRPEYTLEFAETSGSGLNLELKSNRLKSNPITNKVPRPAVSPSPGLFVVGGAAVPDSSLELTGMGTAAVAEAIGPANRSAHLTGVEDEND